MRLTDKVFNTLRKPVIAACGDIDLVHSLLDHRPTAVFGKEEAVVINLITILDKRDVHLSAHPGVIDQVVDAA